METAVVDLFCGVGGLSLGLRNSGLKIVAGVDLDASCKFAYEYNIGAQFIHRDVATISHRELQALFGKAGVRVLAACAPCQPFSGYTSKRRNADDRWKLVFEVLRLADAVKPEIVTVENVPRLARLQLWTDFCAALRLSGYDVSWGIVDCSTFGVPQRRKRLVLLASRFGLISLPRTRAKIGTVRSAIGDLPQVRAGAADENDFLHTSRALTKTNLERIRASSPGGTWKTWPKNLIASCHQKKTGKTYPSVYGRMSWDNPSPTITTQFYGFGNGRFGHPQQDRALTLREGAVLQSFPAAFRFLPEGGRVNFRAIGMMIGNAVPPKLAQALGREILRHAAAFATLNSLNSSASK